MIEIRIHGRGGQGSVTAAELIAVAAFYEGKYTQAFPNFGVERRGAPVQAYARINDKPIRLREQIYNPDYIIIQDPTLIDGVDVFAGLKKNNTIIINSEKKDWPDLPFKNIYAIPVTKIAIETLGRPFTNTGLLAAFATITKIIKFESLVKAVKERFENKPQMIVKNIELMKKICQICEKY